jgi:multidrug efflux system outer membrane protein
MKKIIFILILLSMLLTSCMVGPHYTRPAMEPPQAYIHDTAINASDTLSALKWFMLFEDTVLNNLIAGVLDANNDVKTAMLRIEQSHALYRMSRSDLLPSLGYSAEAEINYAVSDEIDRMNPDVFSVLGAASWEIDLWGKLRHAKRAAYAELTASEETLKSIKTMVISDAANLYFQMRDLDNRIAVSEQTLQTRTQYYNMVNERFMKGEVSELDKLQAEQQLAVVQATLSSLRRQLGFTERSLNVLLDQNPQPVPRGLSNPEQQTCPQIPALLPSSLLDQRPDIRAAEELLKAETERIGITQALRLPSFNLTGFLGLASSDLSSLLHKDAIISNITASILGPIFEFGKNRRRVEAQRKEAEIALNKYLVTYRKALGEVDNALLSIQTYSSEFEARNRQAEAARKSLMLSRERYNGGYTDYLEVLVSETYMFDAEMTVSVTRAQQLSATVSLYRALGGGW